MAVGTWAAASAPARGSSRPPVASRTTRVRLSAARRTTRAAIPASSWGLVHCSPVGRTAMSPRACATSMPTKIAGDSMLVLPSGPGLVRYGLYGPGQRFGLAGGATRRPTLSCGLQRPKEERPAVSRALPHTADQDTRRRCYNPWLRPSALLARRSLHIWRPPTVPVILVVDDDAAARDL